MPFSYSALVQLLISFVTQILASRINFHKAASMKLTRLKPIGGY